MPPSGAGHGTFHRAQRDRATCKERVSKARLTPLRRSGPAKSWASTPARSRPCKQPSSQRREVRRWLSVAALARARTTATSLAMSRRNEPIAELDALVGFCGPRRARVHRRDHLWRLAIGVSVFIIEGRQELCDGARLALGRRPIDLSGNLAMITTGVGLSGWRGNEGIADSTTSPN
jgi:hypothetical protein